MTFKFQPLQFVKIHVFGLNYDARVVRCIKDCDGIIYDVSYARDGQLMRNEFYEDELV